MAAEYFNPHSSQPRRASQAWQILVGAAKNRQTLTYEGLSELMFQKKAAGVLADILGYVALYCNEHDLAPLTTIVVGKGAGAPGTGIPVSASDVHEERERVYREDWYNIVPPSEQNLADARALHV